MSAMGDPHDDWDDVTHDEMQTVHVVPVNDLRDHTEVGTECWCAPKVERFEGGGCLVTHNSMDGRELVERHGLQ